MKKKGLIILTISSVFIILIGIVISYVIIEIKIDKINTYNQDTINEISKNLVEPYPQFPIFALGRGSYQFSTRKIIEEEIKDKFGVTFIKKSFREIEGGNED